MFKFNLKKNRGFTLLEALVATSVLMVAIAAPITIAQKGLSSAVFTKNQMIASYLAQDVLEYIKNKRDEVTINNKQGDWNKLSIFDTCNIGPGFGTEGCQIDTLLPITNANAVTTFQPNSYLKKSTPDKFYGYTNGEVTNFTRQVTIAFIPIQIKKEDGTVIDINDDQALVTVKVVWGAGDNNLVVKALIFNN